MSNSSEIRNIGIMAHIDAGKTTTTERILFYTGDSHKIGNVDEGNTVTDWMEQEKERGITIQSAAITVFWKKKQINIIDTPGHVDFTAEVERSLRVLDGAVAIFCAVGGVEPQSETVWHQSEKYRVPKIAFINKIDRMGADYYRVLKEIKEKLNISPITMTIPVGSESNFSGVIDILNSKMLKFSTESQGALITEHPIPDEYRAKSEEFYNDILDVASQFSDALTEKLLEGSNIDKEEIISAIRAGVLERKLLPVYAGSSLKNIGVQPLLDGVVDFLPPPSIGKSNEVSSLVFKVQNDPQSGFLSYIRVYSGSLKKGVMLNNITRDKKERALRLLRMHSIQATELSELNAGDIGVVVGLKEAYTGDTLSSQAKAPLLESPVFPSPVISVAIEPKSTNDMEKLKSSLQILSHEDPTFTYTDDNQTGQIVISGMGELHLDVLTRRLKDEFRVDSNVGNPQVTYKEGITISGEGEETFSRQISSKDAKATVKLRIEPLLVDNGAYCNNLIEFTKECLKMTTEHFVNLAKEQLNSCFQAGILNGYEIRGMKVTVERIECEDDTPDFAVSSSLNMCFDKVTRTLNPIILEPVMDVSISSPGEYTGDCVNLISTKGGIVERIENKDNGESVIIATVALKKLFGFTTLLRSSSQGRANFSMSFRNYYPSF